MAPKIFNMKRQIQELKKINLPCSERKLREKFASKLNGKISPSIDKKKNVTTNKISANITATAPSVRKQVKVKPSVQPLVTHGISNFKNNHHHFSKDFMGIVKSKVTEKRKNTKVTKQKTIKEKIPPPAPVIRQEYNNYSPEGGYGGASEYNAGREGREDIYRQEQPLYDERQYYAQYPSMSDDYQPSYQYWKK